MIIVYKHHDNVQICQNRTANRLKYKNTINMQSFSWLWGIAIYLSILMGGQAQPIKKTIKLSEEEYAQLIVAQKELDKMKIENAKLKNDNTQLNQEIRIQHKRFRQVESELKNLKSKNDVLEKELAIVKGTSRNYQKKVSILENKKQQLMAQVQKMEIENDRYKTLEERTKTYENRLNKMTNRYAQLKEQQTATFNYLKDEITTFLNAKQLAVDKHKAKIYQVRIQQLQAIREEDELTKLNLELEYYDKHSKVLSKALTVLKQPYHMYAIQRNLNALETINSQYQAINNEKRFLILALSKYCEYATDAYGRFTALNKPKVLKYPDVVEEHLEKYGQRKFENTEKKVIEVYPVLKAIWEERTRQPLQPSKGLIDPNCSN